MSESYIGELRLVGFNFAPVDWAPCTGMVLGISQYNARYNLIGTTYGGDGQTNFQLPNLQGRIPIHQGSSGASTYVLGQPGGLEKVTLTIGQYPNHTHNLVASGNTANGSSAGNSVLAQGPTAYTTASPPVTAMNPIMVGASGNNQAHDNMQPYLVLNWIISLYGTFPSPS
jgi:microcystin-dependent protein